MKHFRLRIVLTTLLAAGLVILFGRTDRRFLSDPAYNGIISIGNGTMTLSVSAECSEEDYNYVRDRLNVGIQRILREHGYTI